MISSASMTMTTLSDSEWKQRAAEHLARAERHTLAARKRRDHGESHPVEDFLFQYYPYPFALLENWHPGCGVALEWTATVESPTPTPPFSDRWYSYSCGALVADPGLLSTKERERLRWIGELLTATRSRAPNFACHGLHEWAMVYRGREVRHEKTTRLRLPQAEIDALVESRAICCSHHDAWIGTELLLDCFELAMELRDLDMRASPYDLSDWGRQPVRIETAEGRRIYETEQRRLAEKAVPLRDRLIERLRTIEG